MVLCWHPPPPATMSANIPQQQHPNAQLLLSATKGFDYLFSNDIVTAREHFKKHDDPFHMMGLGVCAFLEAALGMESGLMAEATRCLAISEAGARQQTRGAKSDMAYRGRFTHGLEWEILNADAVVLLGLTHALSESYMGYLQCMYSLNSAHSKFTKLYKTVFPQGLPPTPGAGAGATLTVPTSTSRPQGLRHKQSDISLASASSVSSLASAATIASPAAVAPAAKVNGFFTRWVGTASTPALPAEDLAPDGPVEDLIVAGTAFGFGLFNLVFSLLPKKVQGLVGFLGFKHDRKLALQALALAATKTDVHGTFAGLVLMTYHGGVLLLSGYQANEEKILIEYQIIVDQIASRYPTGALWILNRAKIMRMSYKADIAIDILNEGLHNNKGHSFAQADMLLVFELAWTLLSQMRYQEAADAFMRITELNSWSHGTYYFITAGCYFSLGDMEKAQSLLDAIPNLIDKKKISGKDLPTEVFIKKKLIFYKEKHLRRTGSEDNFIQSIKISPAEEIGIFWNNHARVSPAIAQTHIDILTTLTPPVSISTANIASSLSRIPPSPRTPKSPAVPMLPTDDLDTPDEHAVRALLLGIHYRTIKAFAPARGFLEEAVGSGSAVRVSTWVAGVAAFELAVLDLKEAAEGDRVRAAEVSDVSATPRPQQNGFGSGAQDPAARRRIWADAMASASARLDTALGLATSSVDLSSRLDSRIAMLRDEIATKGEMLKLSTP
ncbi:hypothetical protein HYPSUDRAFT_218539 [Hypholoma sublateritium FD-334 SS-4]|uniref:Mitochondrial outer membrane protein IML2 n=1 Tax=Hypholoma sublateritium (strain FD-334 SS-4) TaxID=945553 RepID=A0A0D2PCB4_HYPSF|nr:hypothetical protein HYPSUDRAFT_218539 [Hypholoma sublateritium FD-334 SS-4]